MSFLKNWLGGGRHGGGHGGGHHGGGHGGYGGGGVNQNYATAQQGGINCNKCNTMNQVGARFCSNCGNNLLAKNVCNRCNTTNESGAKFCNNCGNNIA